MSLATSIVLWVDKNDVFPMPQETSFLTSTIHLPCKRHGLLGGMAASEQWWQWNTLDLLELCAVDSNGTVAAQVNQITT